MLHSLTSQQKSMILLIIVTITAIFGLWIRFLPMETLTSMSQPVVMDTDPWFTVRQVEQIVSNFPNYAWYDPMISYPRGKSIDWGPVFPTLIATIALITGSTTQGEIIQVGSFICPLLFLLLIPLSFLAGTFIWNQKAGWIAAILISVLGGEAIFRAFYGDFDHHILEMVLSFAFIVAYLNILKLSSNTINKPYKDPKLLLCAICAGLLYYLGIMTMPTLAMLAVIITIATIIFAIVNENKEGIFSLSIINILVFGTFILLYGLYGTQFEGWIIYKYTITHIFIAGVVIAISLILFALIQIKEKLTQIPYIALVLITTLIGIIAISISMPELVHTVLVTFSNLFGGKAGGIGTIEEMQALSIYKLLKIFNLGLLLSITGLIILVSSFLKKRDSLILFSIVWASFMLGISFLAGRFWYYGGITVVILTAISLSYLYSWLDSKKPQQKTQNKKKVNDPKKNFSNNALIITSSLVLIIFGLSSMTAIQAGEETTRFLITEEWISGLNWLQKSSPEPGVNYLEIYDRKSFTYPEKAYTILSWWDYGHWITALSKRIPVTTPFQDYASGVALFLLSENEQESEEIADKFQTKYIITTNEMVVEKFPTIRYWAPQISEEKNYIFSFFSQNSGKPGEIIPMMGYTNDFYNIMLNKLHIMDGSFMPANESILIQYDPQIINGKMTPIMNNLGFINSEQASYALSNPKINEQIISLDANNPIVDTQGLIHYRLVYESEQTGQVGIGDKKYSNLKIFERVTGHTIPGTGTIELPIITNQGREFTWRQKSVNGTFTLPYSTKNNPYDVKATGPYRIAETGEVIEVSEEQIL